MLMPVWSVRKPGNPEGVAIELYDGTKVRLVWDNTEPAAFPQVRVGTDPHTELSQGTTSWNSGQFDSDVSVRFRRAGKFSEWVTGVP